MKRGEIYYADLNPATGSEQGDIRPVIIIQNDIGNRHSPTVIVAPLTTRKKNRLPTHVDVCAEEGISQDSTVLLEQIRTIDKTRLKGFICSASEDTIRQVDNAIKISTHTEERKKEEMNEVSITEYKNIPVLTTQQLAEAYGTDQRIISNNFNRNKERYKEGKHYICLEGEELRIFKTNHQYDESSKINKIYLWTEKGAFLHAKSLGTDKAWEVYEYLVDSYFSKKKLPPMTLPEQIQLLARGNLELSEKIESVDKDLQDFKKDMPLLALECQKITRAKNQKVVPLMGGKDSDAYKDRSLRSQVYTDIDNQLRREFGVNTYKAIKRSQCDLALDIIERYELPMVLANKISEANA